MLTIYVFCFCCTSVLDWVGGISRRTTWFVVRVRCGSRGCIGLGRVSRDAALLVIFCAHSFILATAPTVVARVLFSSSSARERIRKRCLIQMKSKLSPQAAHRWSPLPMATAPLLRRRNLVSKFKFKLFSPALFWTISAKIGACQVERNAWRVSRLGLSGIWREAVL